MRVLVIAIALFLVGCGGSSATPAPARTPRATLIATPRPATTVVETNTPWPSEFASKFCLAVEQNDEFVDGLQAIESAMVAGDYDDLSLKAFATGTSVLAMDTALAMAPAWAPAADVVSAWRAALAEFGPALEEIDAGAAGRDGDPVEDGVLRLADAAELLEEAMPKLQEFIANTGFECP